MPAIFSESGDRLNFIAARTMGSGELIWFGGTPGVTVYPVKEGCMGLAMIRGMFRFEKGTDIAFGQGDTVYWDADNSAVGTSGTVLGVAGHAAPTGDGSVYVILGAGSPVGKQASVTAITDSTGGTAADAIPAAAGSAWTKAEIDNAVASLSEKINTIIGVLAAAGITADAQ